MQTKNADSTAPAPAIAPLLAPALYAQHFGRRRRNAVTLPNPGHPPFVFRKISQLSDTASGFRADAMLDARTGHAVIIYKGMDVPFRDEGNGRLGFLRDAFTALEAKLQGGPNNQTKFAERIYRRTAADPRVKSLEIIGFSLGSLHANHIAAKYGARATVLSDLGLGAHDMAGDFNRAALAQNITSLRMDLDLIPRFMQAGAPPGRVVDLDKGRFPAWSGLIHQARAYSALAVKMASSPGL
jgi:hypothetical protein